MRCHHGPEDAPANVLHLSGAAAVAATRGSAPRLGARPGAAFAGSQTLDVELAVGPERGLLERERCRGEDVVAAMGPRSARGTLPGAEPSPTEESLEQVGDVSERHVADSARAAVPIVLLAFRGIAEDLIGRSDFLEPHFRGGISAHVRVELARQLPVRLLDVLGRGALGDAEDLIEVADPGHRGYAPSSVASSDRRLATARTEAMTET